MTKDYSGNFRVMDAGGMTQSCIGVRYAEDNTPISGVVLSVNTVSKLEVYHTNALRLLPSDWHDWSLANLPPNGLLCVHTEDYPLGAADNILAEAERFRGKVLSEMREAANAGSEGDGTTGVDVGLPGTRPPSNAPLGLPAPVIAAEPTFDPLDKDKDGFVSNKERKGKT